MDNLFIGIDFSKKTIDVSLFEGQSVEKVSYRQFENTLKGFKDFICWIKKQSQIREDYWLFCAEHTGLYSLELSHYLIEKGYFLWLEDPREILLCSGKKREKNDRVDSLAIALYAYRFKDKACRAKEGDKDLASLGLLLSYRNRLVKNKHALVVSASELRKVLEKDPTARYIYEKSYKQIAQINKEIKPDKQRNKRSRNENESDPFILPQYILPQYKREL